MPELWAMIEVSEARHQQLRRIAGERYPGLACDPAWVDLAALLRDALDAGLRALSAEETDRPEVPR